MKNKQKFNSPVIFQKYRQEHPLRKINDFTLFLLAFIYIIPLFISNSICLNILLLLLALFNVLIVRRIRIKLLLLFILFLIPVQISIFLTSLWYTRSQENPYIITRIFGYAIYQAALENAVFLMIRSVSLSVVSFIFLIGINFEALVVSIMQNIKLPPLLGYPLLTTVNAFRFMKDEFFRIRTAYKMRFLKSRFVLRLFFPLLFSASRYAFYAALSMESRGLNNHRTFIDEQYWRIPDTFFLILNLLEIILLLVVFIMNKGMAIRLL